MAGIFDVVFDGPVPGELDHLYAQAGRKWNINPMLLKAQDLYEIGPHGGDSTAGDANHVGHGQIGPAWRKRLGLPDNPSAEQAIDGMAQIMSTLRQKHQGDYGAALQEYTGGPDKGKWGAHVAAYPEQVAARVAQLGGDPSAHQYSPGAPGMFDSLFPEEAQAPAAPSAMPKPALGWGGGTELANALIGGYGPQLSAGVQAAKEHFRSGMSFSAAYDQALPQYQTARGDYQQASPGQAEVNDLLGGVVPAGLAVASGGGLLAAGARGLAEASPALGRALPWMMGALPKAAPALAQGASRILPGAFVGATSALADSGLSEKPLGEQLGTGAAVGGVFGPIAGAAGDYFSSKVAPHIASQVNRLIDAGVPLQSNQIPGVGVLYNALGKLVDNSGSAQRQGLTRAASRSFGADAPLIDEALDRATQTRLGQAYDRFGNATIHKDEKLVNDMMDTVANAHGDFGEGGSGIPDDKLSSFRDLASHIMTTTGTEKAFTGGQFLALTKRGSALDRMMHDPDLGPLAMQLRDHLTGALERSTIAANGRWVPAAEAAAQVPRGPLVLGRSAPNKLLGTGSASDIRLPEVNDSTGVAIRAGTFNQGPGSGFERVPQFVEAPPGAAPRQGMVWEIDPNTQGALQTLRDANGQYKNLKLIRGAVDPTTGEINPAKLASRAARFYPPSANTPETSWSRMIADLAPAKNFIPNAPSGAGTAGSLAKLAHGGAAGLGLGLGAEAVREAWPYIAEHPVPSLAVLAGTMAAGAAGRKAASFATSPAMARVVANSATNASPGATALWQLALTPTATQLYNTQNKKAQGK